MEAASAPGQKRADIDFVDRIQPYLPHHSLLDYLLGSY